MVLGNFFREQVLIQKKNEKKISRNSKRENAYFHVETASGSRQT